MDPLLVLVSAEHLLLGAEQCLQRCVYLAVFPTEGHSEVHVRSSLQGRPRQSTDSCLPCRVAVLDGGLPLWLTEGYKLDESPVSDDDLNAPLRAAQDPPEHLHYSARLQVSSAACLH